LIAAIHIEVVLRNDRSIPLKAFSTPPFKVMEITENPKGGILQLMLMSSSPGVLDGDRYEVKVDVGSGASLELQTQSYQRLFSMKNSASQTFTLNMQPNASFTFLPHPVVPHESSDFLAINKIHLATGCRLAWGEVFTCGRKLNGEMFSFRRYQSITEIFVNDRMVMKENLYMQPSTVNASGMGQLEGYTHQATLIVIDKDIAIKEVMAVITDSLGLQQQIIFGVTSAPVNGIVVRLLGNKAEQLYSCLRNTLGIIQSSLLVV
jgi:urease accessory protein